MIIEIYREYILAIKNRIKIFYFSNLEDLEKQLNEFYAGPELQELITVKFEIITYLLKLLWNIFHL